jgi:dimethylargininase
MIYIIMMIGYLGREFFVGLSKTTNLSGAKAVASAFPEYPVTLLRVLS